MIRVATLKRKLDLNVSVENTAGYTPKQLMAEITAKTRELVERQTNCFHNSIVPALASNEIEFVKWDELTYEEKYSISQTFQTNIFPVLTPLAVDPSHPFPYISGLSLNLAVVVRNPESETEYFARVKVPSNLQRFFLASNDSRRRFIAIEDILSAHIDELFPGMEIVATYPFRLTRNADLELEEEESEDLLATMEQELLRRKFGPPVRLEVDSTIDIDWLDTLTEEIGVEQEEIVKYRGPLDLTGLFQIADLAYPLLKYPNYRSQAPWDLRECDGEDDQELFDAIRRREVLLHHPYESFTTSVVRFLEAASEDPQVLAIKQTLYRTSGDSPIIEALIEAAQAGKQVLAVIEIRARFDEQANVRWARKLEDAGVHVVYGLVGLKTHAKLSLVVREEAGGIRRYVHVGTGNYNPKTARIYEDFGLMSADPVLGEDVNRLFNQLSGFAPQTTFNRLLVAPRTIRPGLIDKIQQEIYNKELGKPAGIQIKLNSLLDEEFINLLYKASNAGVKIDLIVRGICALRAGIPGMSENIRVRSILGRFLEHSRIFHFTNGGEDEYWIGSADLMHRNLDRRVEAMVRIDQNSHKRTLQRALDSQLSDAIPCWELNRDGTWHRKTKDHDGTPLVDFHTQVIKWYESRES
jgi:polyphosphate kinase